MKRMSRGRKTCFCLSLPSSSVATIYTLLSIRVYFFLSSVHLPLTAWAWKWTLPSLSFWRIPSWSTVGSLAWEWRISPSIGRRSCRAAARADLCGGLLHWPCCWWWTGWQWQCWCWWRSRTSLRDLGIPLLPTQLPWALDKIFWGGGDEHHLLTVGEETKKERNQVDYCVSYDWQLNQTTAS